MSTWKKNSAKSHDDYVELWEREARKLVEIRGPTLDAQGDLPMRVAIRQLKAEVGVTEAFKPGTPKCIDRDQLGHFSRRGS